MGAALNADASHVDARPLALRRPAARLLAIVAAGACCALAAVPAAAQTTVYAPTQGTPNSVAIPIQVTANVGTHCTFAINAAPTGTFNQPDFDTSGFTHDFPFTLDCTGPARVAVVSSNGGLMTSGATTTGYAALAPYDVTLNLVATGGAPTASATCTAATLTTGSSCSFIGPAGQTQGLRLGSASIAQSGSYIRVSAPVYAGSSVLISGTYQDILTVTVSPST
jgi:hypothetical protein